MVIPISFSSSVAYSTPRDCDAEVYARGEVRHRDHKTIDLVGWHRVYMNRERFARHAQQIAFWISPEVSRGLGSWDWGTRLLACEVFTASLRDAKVILGG
jgi:hypothetical protein